MLVESPSDMLKELLALDNIAKTYKEKIAVKDFRGIDHIGRYQFERNKDKHFEIINRKCLNGTYKYSPFVEKLQLRGRNREPRVISIPTMRDRVVLSLLKDYLHKLFPDCVNRKLPNTYIKEIKDYYGSAPPDICFYKVDIKSFYDTIKHHRLMEIISVNITSKPDLLLIKRAIQTPSVSIGYRRDSLKEIKNTCGVPQGLAISNILANIYIHQSDINFEKACLKYFRYVDDMLFVVRQTEEKTIESTVKKELNSINLSINKKKTSFVIVNADNSNIDYLGYNLRLPTVGVKQATAERYLHSLSALFSSYLMKNRQALPEARAMIRDIFVSDVNERITGAIRGNRRYGWIFYFLEMNDLALLHMIDKIILDKFCSRIKEESTWLVLIKSIKKVAKAYYHAKYDPLKGYIHNYDSYDTIPKKIKYLISIGNMNVDESTTFSPEDIERIFDSVVSKRLAALESDLGETS